MGRPVPPPPISANYKSEKVVDKSLDKPLLKDDNECVNPILEQMNPINQFNPLSPYNPDSPMSVFNPFINLLP